MLEGVSPVLSAHSRCSHSPCLCSVRQVRDDPASRWEDFGRMPRKPNREMGDRRHGQADLLWSRSFQSQFLQFQPSHMPHFPGIVPPRAALPQTLRAGVTEAASQGDRLALRWLCAWPIGPPRTTPQRRPHSSGALDLRRTPLRQEAPGVGRADQTNDTIDKKRACAARYRDVIALDSDQQNLVAEHAGTDVQRGDVMAVAAEHATSRRAIIVADSAMLAAS